MSKRKVFAGAKLRALRTQNRLTQTQLAERLEVSPSYVNQMESNQRPITAAVMLSLVEKFNLDLTDLMADNADRIVKDLREVMADPVFGEAIPGLQELKSVASTAPDTAQALLRLYEAYRKGTERLASLDAAMTGPGGEPMKSPYEEVRDFFHYANNYIDPLDRAAEALAAEIGLEAGDPLDRLTGYVAETHDIRIETMAPRGAMLMRDFDRGARVLRLNGRLEEPSRFFQIAAQLALMEQTTAIDGIVEEARFKTEEARDIARMGLANYFAGALSMPYGRFLKAAEALRYDIEELGQQFSASLEQVGHRLSTLQRTGQRGVPFFFARVDAAGTITKRHSATPLQFARFGGACPLWNVHRAFEAHGQIIRQRAETPDGQRYLCLAWAQEKRLGGFRGPVRRYAYALGCAVSDADRLVYAEDLDLSGEARFDPIGISCRICERRDCAQRSVPPVAARIEITPDHREIVPYTIV